MTIVVELTEELEALLKADAEQEQRPVEEVAVERLLVSLKRQSKSDPVAIEAIRESLEDIEAGREMDLEEYILRRQNERTARRAGQALK